MRLFAVLAAACLLVVPVSAMADATLDFACSNPSMEVRCADGRCDFTGPDDGFTPMQLGRTGETLTICAYSGCWSGSIVARHETGETSILQAYVSRKGDAHRADNEAPELLSVIHDAGNRTAQMNWAGFANAMVCDLAP